MPTTSVSATTPILRTKFGRAWSRQLRAFLFQSDSGEWLSILRIGLGLEVTLYASSLWADWGRMFARSSTGFLNREFTEAVLSIQSPLVPRMGWFVWMGERAGLSEQTSLMIVWLLLFAAGCFLVVGLCCRTAAIAAWLIHLCSAKTGGYLAYGMDNFLTIGLFYLAIAPLPDRLALDRKLRRVRPRDPEVVGFFRRVLQLHLCVIYFFGGLTKCLGAGWWNGTNIWRSLTIPPFNVLPIHWVASLGFLLLPAGIAICLLEVSYPFLIWWRPSRKAVLV